MKPLEWGSLECAGNESIDFDGIGVSVIEVSSLIRKDSPTIESMFLNLAECVAAHVAEVEYAAEVFVAFNDALQADGQDVIEEDDWDDFLDWLGVQPSPGGGCNAS